jgi:hypothetical protein
MHDSRYACVFEFVIATLNENVNIALYNIDSFGNWLNFLKTLPNVHIMETSLHQHIEEVLKHIKVH